MRHQPQLYTIRARLWGSVHWICPYSGHLNQSRVNPDSYHLICAVGTCNRRFIPGLVLYAPNPGRQSIPPDWIIPVPGQDYTSGCGMRDAFPEGDLAVIPWRRHSPTHVFIDPSSTDFDVRSMVRTVRTLAETGRHGDFVNYSGNPSRATSAVLERLGAAFLTVSAGYGY